MKLICNLLFFTPYTIISLINEGMYIKAVPYWGIWYCHRFYKYGSFGVCVYLGGGFNYSNFWILKIYNIHKKYSFFARDTTSFTIAKNNEIQDIRKFLTLLREKTQEALEAQGKAECYNLKEKIQYKPRKDF